jgi:hypothetical protein
MIKKFKITAIEQGWLDSFNSHFLTNYQLNQVLKLNQTDCADLLARIEEFNETIAYGYAIDLEEVD